MPVLVISLQASKLHYYTSGMQLSTGLAYHTLGWSWTVTSLAAVSLVLQAIVKYKQSLYSFADGLLVIAWCIGVAMVAQSTWAIIDEG